MSVHGAAVIGAGYWGPNLVRNMAAHDRVELRWVCDLDEDRARRVLRGHGAVAATSSFEAVLDDSTVELVAIATPADTHVELGLAALDADKHVLLEKPLAPTLDGGRKLVAAAEAAGRVLMCDHTYCYTPVVERIRALVAAGELGDVLYVDSVRINLGLVQRDVDVIWDLSPHDLSILDEVLPVGSRPTAVASTGADPAGVGQRCIAHLSLPLGNGGLAHSHVNWLSPTKMRRVVIAGSRRMLVWDDLQPASRLQIFDSGVELELSDDDRRHRLVSYRSGDMVAPALPEREALGGVIDELVAAVEERREPRTGGASGLRVLDVLECASRSLDEGGALIPLREPW